MHPVGAMARRAGQWLAWWAILMSLWIIADDSVQADELLAGAGAAALAAAFAVLVSHLANIHLQVRARWLWRALRLPARVARDTGAVFAALGRTVASGVPPRGEFREIPMQAGPAGGEGVSRRALMVASTSLAPNTFVLGIDSERNIMVVHQLVTDEDAGR